MPWWQSMFVGMCVSWPPALLALWLGKRKLARVTAEQTSDFATITSKQTDVLKPGWRAAPDIDPPLPVMPPHLPPHRL